MEQNLPSKQFWERHCFASWNGIVQAGHWEQILLCNMMHTDGAHLAFNMMTLFFIGRNVEYVLGFYKFIAFYLVGGAFAAGMQLVDCYNKRQMHVGCIGASGGVYALLAFLTCLMPHQTVMLYMIIPMPLWLLTTGVLVLDVVWLRPGMGQTAHLAGAGFGAIFYVLRYRPWR